MTLLERCLFLCPFGAGDSGSLALLSKLLPRSDFLPDDLLCLLLPFLGPGVGSLLSLLLGEGGDLVELEDAQLPQMEPAWGACSSTTLPCALSSRKTRRHAGTST